MKSTRAPNSKKNLPSVGWREWIALPELGIKRIKVKVDTGARSSALHAFDLEKFERDGVEMVRFRVHPQQRSGKATVVAEAKIIEYRRVRSSSGFEARRPVIVTQIELLGRSWPIELTLAARDEMGFRMLLGRQAIRRRVVVDPGRSYLNGRPPVKRRKQD